MEEDTELEEGEALEGRRPANLNNMDNLDKRVESVLGHHQKDFQGTIQRDKRGPKFGDYGSFLPTQVRWEASPAAPNQPPVKLPVRSRPARGAPDRQMRASSTLVGAASNRIPKTSVSDPGQSNEKREQLKSVELKRARSTAATRNDLVPDVDEVRRRSVYNGSGLDSSPSLGDDSHAEPLASEDEVSPGSPDSQDSPDRSPSYMIRIMTTHHLPHGGLLSPLPALLSEPFEQEGEPSFIESQKKRTSAPSVSQPDTGSVATKTDGILGKEGKSIKEKKEKASERAKAKLSDRRAPLEQSNTENLAKKELESERARKTGVAASKAGPRAKKDMKFNKANGDAGTGIRDVFEYLSEDNDWEVDFRKEKVVSSGLPKDNGTDVSFGGFSRYIPDGDDESKTLKDLVTNLSGKEKRKSGGSKESSKVQVEDEAQHNALPYQQVQKEVGTFADDDFGERLSMDGDPEPRKIVHEGNKAGRSMLKEAKDRVNGSSKQSRRDTKRNSKKEGSSFRAKEDYGAEESKSLSKQSAGDFKGRSSDFEKEDVTYSGVKPGKVAKKPGRKPVSKSRDWEVESLNSLPVDVAPAAAPVLVSQPELLPALGAPQNLEGAPPPQLVLDYWVLCDKCERWRLVKPGFEEEAQTHKIWECRMMDWLPGMNDCKYPEEQTTQAVYELLGMQNPNHVQASAGQQAQLRVAVEPQAVAHPPQPKPKVPRSNSKKRLGATTPRVAAQRGRKPEMSSAKSKSFNDIGQHAADRIAGRNGVDIPVYEDRGEAGILGWQEPSRPVTLGGMSPLETEEVDKPFMENARAVPEKRKFNDILPVKRRPGSEDYDMRPDKQARKFTQDSDPGKVGVHSGRGSLIGMEMEKVADDNMWPATAGPAGLGNKRKGKLLPSGSNSDSVGAKRKRRTESSEENDYQPPGKMSKVAESREWKATQPLSQTSIASKVSFSAESALGSKRVSPVESTVSSSPVRSSRLMAREGVQDNNVIVETSNSRARDDHYAMSNSREALDTRRFDRNQNRRGDEAALGVDDSREMRGGSAGLFTDRFGQRDERYQEREDSVDRYHERENRYDRKTGRDDRSRDRDRDRDQDRSRDTRTVDRGGGETREDQYSRERSMKQDRPGRPSSRESRLEKQGSLNGREEVKTVRDLVREGRDRMEDDTNNTNKHRKPGDEVHPHENGLDGQKGDPGHRFENPDRGLPKDTKVGSSRPLPGAQGSLGWEGEKMGVSSTGRRDSEASASRVGQDSQTYVNNIRARAESAPVSAGISRKLDNNTGDARINKELKKAADEDGFQKSNGARPFGSSSHTSSSPSKKDSASQLIKEAREMKHKADRLSGVSDDGESTTLYLSSALKFLKAAHQQEMAASEGVRQAETARPTDLYNDTARLCDFCAEKYEKQRDLAAAALSYVCAALARFRATVSKAPALSKDCTELQNATTPSGSRAPPALTPPRGAPSHSEKPASFQGAQPAGGESPSSSPASDLDNLNHHAFTNDKGLADTPVKGSAQPTVPASTNGSTDLVPPNLHTNFNRMLSTGLDVVAMVESWTKAHNAILAAEAACAGNPRLSEGIVDVKKVGEIGFFGNMDSVVMHAQRALDTIGH